MEASVVMKRRVPGKNKYLLGHAVIHGRLSKYWLMTDDAEGTHCTADVVEKPIIVDAAHIDIERVLLYTERL